MAHTPKNQSEKAILTARRAWCYLVLVLISFLCLFFFYVLVINSTRTHFEIQKGFSLVPGKSIVTNLRNVLTDANIPVMSGIRNSLLVSACSAALSVYFSALTAYGIYAYNFRFKKAAFAIILLIMTMPTQVSALGFLQLITKMGLKNSFIPLIIPSIAAPAVFFFMKQRIRNTSVSNNILPPKSLLVICGNARICSGLTETVSFPFRPRALQQRNISIKMFTNQDITAFSEIWKIIPYLLSQNGIWALTFTHRRALSMNQAEES